MRDLLYCDLGFKPDTVKPKLNARLAGLQARQAKAQAREQQYYQLVSASKSGPAADVAVDLQAASKSMSRQVRFRALES